MPKTFVAAATILVIFAAPLAADERVAGLIAQLDTDSSAERDAASRQLVELAPAAAAAVEEAAKKHASPEVRIRAADVLQRMAGRERSDNELGLKLVWCPPGKFQMGRWDSGKPRNEVDVTLSKGYWIGKYEVTQGEWKAVMKTTPWADDPHRVEDDRRAASHMSWYDARDFCRALTESERSAGRLRADERYDFPTEAQWEYACRAGTTAAFFFEDEIKAQPIEKMIDTYALHAGNKDVDFAHRVGTKRPNPWGLYDIQGNVREWCRDAAPLNTVTFIGGVDPCVVIDDPLADLSTDNERLARIEAESYPSSKERRSRSRREHIKGKTMVQVQRHTRGASWRENAEGDFAAFRSACRFQCTPKIGGAPGNLGMRVALVRDTAGK